MGIEGALKTTQNSALFRRLPSVDESLREPAIAALVLQHGPALVTEAVRNVLDRMREQISCGLLDDESLRLALGGIAAAVENEMRAQLRHSLRAVINATGVILHTNLGRAPLADAAIEHIRETATRYSNLEFDLEAGERGKRDVHVDRLFRQLVAEEIGTAATISTIVVNNNAAAVLLALNTLAEGGEVVVSRGELVEIGGSFRIPDVMAKSGAILHEVGTTNRTRIADYANAISERTRLLLKVHRSNFEITGFTEQPTTAELSALAAKAGIPLMEDLGSGALINLRNFGITGEPDVLDSLRAGVQAVTYSGDKLLGGPQAGLISGKRELIARMRSNSLFRALRVDKLTYGALEATLLAYLKRDHDSVPALRMMRLSKEEIKARAEALIRQIPPGDLEVEIIDGESVIGGGAAPSSILPTCLIALSHRRCDAGELSARLRESDPAIIGRVEEGRVLLDLRTVFPEQEAMIVQALQRIAS